MKKLVTDKAPAAIGPYSQAIEVNGMVYTSGMIPVNPATGEIPEGTVAQANQALTNLKNLLEAAGTSMDNVIKTTVFIKEMNEFGTINEVYKEYFTSEWITPEDHVAPCVLGRSSTIAICVQSVLSLLP